MQVIREDVERAAAMLQVADEQNFAPVAPAAPVEMPAIVTASAPAPEAPVTQPVPPAEMPRPAAQGPSRPDNAHVLRRRDTRPRNLNLKPAPAVVAPVAEPSEPVAEQAPLPVQNSVPINTTPLNEVDDRLMEAGILPRVVDKLDAKRPVAAAETGVLPAAESVEVAPLDFVMSVPQQNAVAAAAAAPIAPAVPDMPAPAFVSQPEPVVAPAFEVPPPAIFAAEDTPVPAETGFKLPEPVAAAPAPAPLAEAVAPASDLPWAQAPVATMEAEIPPAADNGWTVPAAPVSATETQGAIHPDNAPPPAPPPLDVFKTLATPDTGATIGAPLPGYPRAGAAFPPPELPGSRARTGAPMNRPSGSSLPLVAGAAVVVLAVLGAYWWVGRSSGTPLEEQMAAITKQPAEVQPEIVDANLGSGVNGAILQPPIDVATAGQGGVQPLTPPTGNAVVDFADVPPADMNKPIVADGTEKMPDELGLVASFQQAVAAEKAKQKANAAQGNSPAVNAPAIQPDTAVAVQKEVASDKLKQDLNAELAAYRQALAQADSVAASPKPSEFFADPKAYMGKAPGEAAADGTTTTASTSGETGILPPPANGAGLPPSELYTNNPNNLPLIPEPTSAATQKVRTLEDFNVAAFEPETDRVRIPRGLKPRVSLSEFPEMDVLSFVPGKGLIALYQGNEGVLLLGESIEGWELVGVNADNAEFRKGQKTNYVSAE